MSKAVLFGMIKKVSGGKSGIDLNCGEMALDSGSIKDLFGLAKKEAKVRIEIEPFQDEMFDDPPGETDDDDDLFDGEDS